MLHLINKSLFYMLHKHTDYIDFARTYNTPRTLTSPTSHSVC